MPIVVCLFDMKIFVNVARLEIGQLFTQGARRGHPCTLDTFLVSNIFVEANAMNSAKFQLHPPYSL